MEVTMSLNSLPRLPLSTPRQNVSLKSSFLPSHRMIPTPPLQPPKLRRVTAVEAKGRRGGMMPGRQYQRPPPGPQIPKIEDDGNPKFVIFIRSARVYMWYPLSVVSGGTTAKIILSAKDNFLGKYIYKDTLDRNLASVIYRDEKEIQEMARNQNGALRDATEFRYGYKLIENYRNLKSAFSTSNIKELPTREELVTVFDRVFDRVKDFFGEFTLEKVKGFLEEPKKLDKVKGFFEDTRGKLLSSFKKDTKAKRSRRSR